MPVDLLLLLCRLWLQASLPQRTHRRQRDRVRFFLVSLSLAANHAVVVVVGFFVRVSPLQLQLQGLMNIIAMNIKQPLELELCQLQHHH